MNDWEEKIWKTCQLCTSISGLWFKRETFRVHGETEKANELNDQIDDAIEFLKQWLLKEQ